MFDPTVPNSTQTGVAAVDSSRDNLVALRDDLISAAPVGWDVSTTGSDPQQPDSIVHSHGPEQIRETLTWGTSGGATGNVTRIVREYSDDSGATWAAVGTVDITYTVGGDFAAATWS